jgi:riboflavin biosynthesis pyrimidine reductase
MPLEEALAKAAEIYGDILIEAGPSLVQEAMDLGLLTELFLTISPISGGEHSINKDSLIFGAKELSRVEVDGVLFLHYRLAPTHD